MKKVMIKKLLLISIICIILGITVFIALPKMKFVDTLSVVADELLISLVEAKSEGTGDGKFCYTAMTKILTVKNNKKTATIINTSDFVLQIGADIFITPTQTEEQMNIPFAKNEKKEITLVFNYTLPLETLTEKKGEPVISTDYPVELSYKAEKLQLTEKKDIEGCTRVYRKG
ncbi:MAG: hypothetical protein ACRC6X_06485 [Culicoidibacterales bacterium]